MRICLPTLAAFRPGRAATVRGLFSAYTVHDVVLLADADHARLGGFFRFGVSPQRDRAAVTQYGDAGLVWFGPLGRPPEDTLGLAVSVTRFAPDYRRLQELAATERTVELTYRARLTRRCSVQFDAQLLAHPALRPGATVRKRALAVGVRSTAQF
jgi:carbohydrate-selective porin OprB